MNDLSVVDLGEFVEIRIWERSRECPRPLCCGMVENVFSEAIPDAFGPSFLHKLIAESSTFFSEATA